MLQQDSFQPSCDVESREEVFPSLMLEWQEVLREMTKGLCLQLSIGIFFVEWPSSKESHELTRGQMRHRVWDDVG